MSEQDIIERTQRFLEQQRELFGDFSASLTPETQDISTPPTSTDQPDIKPVPTLSQKEQLAACSTLEELREFCEQSDKLRTDLPNTNLVFGVGNSQADLMIIGEAPGEQEDKQGEPFVGAAGQLLDKIMAAIQFTRDHIYIANILKHRPPNNRDPKPEERQRSLPFLIRQIELVNPKLILCVGKVSATTLLGRDSTLKNMRQKFHPFMGRELMVTYHPAALLRNPQWKRPTWEDVQQLKARYDELGGTP
ncbi:MAG: uracil-DNA glycosylase [Bacteroidota bacterium]